MNVLPLEVFMLSLWCGYLWRAATEIFVHIQKAHSLEKNITEHGKLLKLHCFPQRTHGALVIIVSLQTTWMSTATQETSKMVPQRDLTYLYENFCRRRMSLSYWHKGGQKQTWCTHTKYTYAPFNVHTEISLRSLATNTNTALNVSTSKQPKWVFLKHCQSVKYGQYFRLLYVPLTLTY